MGASTRLDGLSARPREPVNPAAPPGWLDDAELPLSLANLLFMGILLMLLGLLLFPVFLSLLPYSPDGQFGLTLVLMAVQAMALGATPLGDLNRPTLMRLVGLIFAGLGIVASIVPGLLTEWLRILIAALNIGNGAKVLLDVYRPSASKPEGAANSPSGVGARATLTAVGALSIVFGLASLVPGLLPGPLLAALLVLMGLSMFRPVSLLRTRALPEPRSA